jgi:hypothetical protein
LQKLTFSGFGVLHFGQGAVPAGGFRENREKKPFFCGGGAAGGVSGGAAFSFFLENGRRIAGMGFQSESNFSL